jgi:hypothetical protein
MVVLRMLQRFICKGIHKVFKLLVNVPYACTMKEKCMHFNMYVCRYIQLYVDACSTKFSTK